MPSHVHADGVVHDHPMSSHHVDLPGLPSHVDIFDTILRDGSQQEGLSLTVEDKIRVAEQLDNLGVALQLGVRDAGNGRCVIT